MTVGNCAKHQDLYIGLVRVHVLYHASKEMIFGVGLIEELGRHGYRLSPGTIYPLLHSMKRRGWLKVREEYKQWQGAWYSLATFHDRALQAGAVPLTALGALLK